MQHYRKLKRIKGGSNCDVYLYKVKKLIYVIKISGNESIDSKLGSVIIEDYIRIKNRLSISGIKVPKTKNIYITSTENANLVIIESYCGKSLREILKSSSITLKKKINLVKKCVSYVYKFPEDIPLDTNPGNLVLDKNDISFVDFIPPDPWKYKKNTSTRSSYIKIFPSLKSSNYKNKKLSYYSNKYRVSRLLFHCKNICPKIEKYL